VKWHRDPHVWTAIAVGLVLRVVPALLWLDDGCVRDECSYIHLSDRFAQGQGMTSSSGWLWAPGYPVLLGIAHSLTGFASTFKAVQVVAAAVSTVLVYLLAAHAFPGADRPQRAPRTAMWLYALSVHVGFFATRLWSEVVYSTILMGGLLLLFHARSWVGARGLAGALAVGLLGGVCVLFRGVATYMLPILMFGVLWARWRAPLAWAQAGLLALAAATTVAPYSLYATEKFGGTVISDRTLGQMMWLGNNDFDPITFDYGNGQLSKRAFGRTARMGREPCGDKDDAIDRDDCQTRAGVAWIKENPEEFISRMPLRVAQLMNPHSLLTRHLRWGRFPGVHQLIDEAFILVGCAQSLLVMWAGAAGLALRGRGAWAVVFAGILLYHVAAIAVLAGLSRYRVPLEPLLMVGAAGLLASPRAAVSEALASPLRWRVGAAALVLALVVPLSLWFLPAGWPWWRSW
jgi:hypothetical protein